MLRAVGNNVLVKLSQEEVVSPGGIVLPTRDSEMVVAEVVSVGGGTQDCTPTCSVGDMVLIGYYSPHHVFTQGQDKLLYVKFDDIIGIQED